MSNIALARTAKNEKFLSTLIRTSAYGICTRSQRLDQALADGAKLEAAEVRDEARERAIERELKSMMGSGFGVPTGNVCHPITIKYNKLKAELANGPKMIEYRLHRPDGDYWNVITKTEFEYAQSV
jgi:hypothetical protein